MRTNRPKSRAGGSRVTLLMLIVIAAVLVGWNLPVVREAREAAREAAGGAVANYTSSFGDLTSRLPWMRPASPYLNHQDFGGAYEQKPAGMRLPWMRPSSPYLDHE